MEFWVLDSSFENVHIVDTFESLIWTDRFFNLCDFEVYSRFDPELFSKALKGRYMHFAESDRLMIIDSSRIETDVEEGPHLTISGKGIESILNRRIVWKRTILTGNFQDGILRLLNENAITPTDTDRVIPGLTFQASTDPRITALTIDVQLTGENLYDTIHNLCLEKGVGFKLVPDYAGNLAFQLYLGEDRTYDQDVNPNVIFSPNFDNLLSSDYFESDATLKNVALVGGEGEGADRKYQTVGTATGLDRREMFVDANSVTSSAEVTGGAKLTSAQYNAQLQQKGRETLAENSGLVDVSGEVDISQGFKYGVDFFLGDYVQMENEFGTESVVQVTEMVFSQDATKQTAIPTFELVS